MRNIMTEGEYRACKIMFLVSLAIFLPASILLHYIWGMKRGDVVDGVFLFSWTLVLLTWCSGFVSAAGIVIENVNRGIKTLHGYRLARKKGKLPKAVGYLPPGSKVGVVEKQRNVCFPHNHLAIMGIKISDIKKYIPPVATIIFCLNLSGCESDFEVLIVSLYVFFFAVGILILLALFVVLLGVWRAATWLWHIRK